MITTFLDYLMANFTNFWWALFVYMTYLILSLIVTLGFIIAAMKLIIKEYFSWKFQYDKAHINKKENDNE